ncbi:MAG: alkaline phosphatase family protein [bacterium]
MRKTTISSWLNKIRRTVNLRFTRGPALLRRMGIPFSDAAPGRRGFILVQIDGLSYRRLLNAMGHRKLPFLRMMLRKGRLRLHKYLSEIPTSTPAFQGGLFYGDNDEIPGFQFYDKHERRLYRMGNSECANDIQESFTNPGLMRGGSVFSAVYTGGAEGSMFVFSTMLAPRRWKFALRVWDIIALSFLNIMVFFKIALLIVVELALALYDALKWALQRGVLRRQLEFIGCRIGISIITRELITTGAVTDILRGVPRIYVNFLGYDEHAHHRGPDSPVALWTLRGIDRCIRRIYAASLFSGRRYDFFVISDHGQCACAPFELIAGESLAEHLQGQLDGMLVESYTAADQRTAHLLRSVDAMNRLLLSMPRLFRAPIRAYANHLRRAIARAPGAEKVEMPLDVNVVSSGPVAYVYWNRIDHALTAGEIEERHPGLIARLANHPGIGFISMRARDGVVLARGVRGEALIGAHGVIRQTGAMPFDASPYREHIIAGIRRVTMFRRAGDICIWGGGAPGGNVSYTDEYGAHSGWTDDETAAFIFSPTHVKYNFQAITRHTQLYEYFMGGGRHTA